MCAFSAIENSERANGAEQKASCREMVAQKAVISLLESLFSFLLP